MKKFIFLIVASMYAIGAAAQGDASASEFGFSEISFDVAITMRPGDKIYGVHTSSIYKMFCIAFDEEKDYHEHGSNIFTLGAGVGGKYLIGPAFVQAKLYPYLGSNSYQVPNIKDGTYGPITTWETQHDFVYGAKAYLGAGLKVYTDNSDINWYAIGGYIVNAYKFKFENISNSSLWNLGIAWVF